MGPVYLILKPMFFPFYLATALKGQIIQSLKFTTKIKPSCWGRKPLGLHVSDDINL